METKNPRKEIKLTLNCKVSTLYKVKMTKQNYKHKRSYFNPKNFTNSWKINMPGKTEVSRASNQFTIVKALIN